MKEAVLHSDNSPCSLSLYKDNAVFQLFLLIQPIHSIIIQTYKYHYAIVVIRRTMRVIFIGYRFQVEATGPHQVG
jgi:hypothetical protein